MRRKAGFKKGNIPANKGKTIQWKLDGKENNSKYVRLSKEDFKLTVKDGDDILVARDCEGDPCNIRLLRPHCRDVPMLDQMCSVVDDEAELASMRLLQLKNTQVMFFQCYKEHGERHVGCDGMLCFDMKREKKVGLAWQESLKCEKCTYMSTMYKLYEEVPSTGRGRRAAVPNVGVHIGLSHASLSMAGLRTVMMAMDVPPPSQSGMQKSANRVMQSIVKVNEKDMRDRRLKLREINIIKNLPAEDPFQCQGDGRFSTPLRHSGGLTPFAPSSQSVYTIIVGSGAKNQIVALSIQNQLCKIGALIAATTGNYMICQEGGHAGHCSATIAPDYNIGDEYAWAMDCFKQIAEDGLVMKYVTTDADSRASHAAQAVFGPFLGESQVVHLLDTRHLGASQKRYIIKLGTGFSLEMFQTHTKATKERQLRLFADDLSSRCTAEFSSAFNFFKGNFPEVKQHLKETVNAIMRCVQGDHSHCKRSSFVCGGLGNNSTCTSTWMPSFRSPHTVVNCSPHDLQILQKCIMFRLGEDTLDRTRLNTNTQAVESVNRLYGVRNPKNITWSRNVFGILNSAAHEYNNGIGQSILLQNKELGLTSLRRGTKVLHSLRAIQNRSTYNQNYRKKYIVKLRRKIRRAAKFRMHKKKGNSQQTYKKDLLLEEELVQINTPGSSTGRPTRNRRPTRVRAKNDHTYSFAVKSPEDHNYCAKT